METKSKTGKAKNSRSNVRSNGDARTAGANGDEHVAGRDSGPVSARSQDSRGKNIVIFSDGTGQEGGVGNNTNVYALFNMILDRSEKQISFYDQGLGTGDNRLWGSIVGAGISENVGEAYQFLSDNFKAGDRIYLFGFSRGATTVRSLTGFIHLFGILPASRPELFYRAWNIYRIRNKARRIRKAEQFINRNHTMWTKIRFLGVWDTVAALELPFKLLNVVRSLIPGLRYSYHDLRMSESVEYGRHALAIDEQRHVFRPVLFEERGANAAGQFSNEDITDLDLVAETLNDEDNPVSKRVIARLRPAARELLGEFKKLKGRLASPDKKDRLRSVLVDNLNTLIENGEAICDVPDVPKGIESAYNKNIASLPLSAATRESMDQISTSSPVRDINRLNRLLLEDVYSLKPRIKQVWFAGMHSDVGGGYAENELAHIPLLWMISEAMDLGLKIYSEHKVDLKPDATGTMHNSRSGLGRLYRSKQREWNQKLHQGRAPLVHKSVNERQRAVRGYKPWITKDRFQNEPWPVRLQRSIQYNEERIWRRAFWGWGAAFNEQWKDIERISLNESMTAITLHMRETGPIHVQGSLPHNLQAFVNRLERIREHHRLRTVDGEFEKVYDALKQKVTRLDEYITEDNERAKVTDEELASLRSEIMKLKKEKTRKSRST